MSLYIFNLKNTIKFLLFLITMVFVLSFSAYSKEVARLSVHWSPKHHCAKHAQMFAEKVYYLSEGKLRIEVFPSKQLFGIREVMGAVTSGAVELGGIVGVVSFPPINKNFNIASFPGLFSSYDEQRGFFKESWNEKYFNTIVGIDQNFVQDNHSFSIKGVIRGMHYQKEPMAQGKLIRCIRGEIYDVIVDIREKSQTFLKWKGIELNSKNNEQLWVPKGFAHGFLTLTDEAEVQYKTTEYWSKDHEEIIKWDDPQISIKWPITKSPKVSQKDNKVKNL